MIQVLRRMGIAFGSFVAAWLCVTLVGTLFMGMIGAASSPATGGIAWLVAIVLGWLIYRDILRRDARA